MSTAILPALEFKKAPFLVLDKVHICTYFIAAFLSLQGGKPKGR